ncbi:helix-turn-helix transcriptional regulator [Intrasporangium sp.]|uniref:helix-turn-helix transcriptional regulator n=1 Tax=Intrasporangium sp. TaxID=1925024 RepID=UPI00293B7D4A|nr:WYL domain-containing protein [Intrasporangium sp.]MDV3222140.1 WYL domain-containing protein [Intrasporangium sp.]
MRADRLVATMLLLQSRGRVTAAEVAAELEVSVATARRDLEALSSAGVPVYPQAGRGGGWQLVGGARTDLSGLSAPEAQALFLLVGPAAAASDEARAALRKLVQALPRTFRADAEAAATATTVDPARWSEPTRSRPAPVDALQGAVVARQRVRLGYANARGVSSDRLVEPLGLVDKDDVWYLIAGTDRGQRTFRVDRVTSIEPTGESFDRPTDFDLDAAWAAVVDHVEQRRAQTWATVLVEDRFVPIMRDRFGLHCRDDGRGPNGWTRLRVAAPTPLDLARNLAGWGGLIDVLDPPSVRDHLARIGAELTSRFSP